MNATGKRRLLKLADFLKKLPKSKGFHMRSFAEALNRGRPACGTRACAAGWAAAIPSFKRAGYHLTGKKEGDIIPAFKRRSGSKALEAFFDLDEAVTNELFGWFNPVTGEYNPDDPKKAAARIRKAVASH